MKFWGLLFRYTYKLEYDYLINTTTYNNAIYATWVSFKHECSALISICKFSNNYFPRSAFSYIYILRLFLNCAENEKII